MSKYDTILVTTDFSEPALAGVREAAALARALGSKVVLLYVVEDRLPPLLDAATWKETTAEHRRIAGQRLGRYALEHLDGSEHETRVDSGRPHDTILDVAEQLGADLLVMSTHGHGLVGQALLGSTTERVLRHARCPVLVVHAPPALGEED